MTLSWLEQPLAQINTSSQQQAEQHNSQLTKPPGALGQLESVAIRLAAMQASTKPAVDNIHINVFAADHGIANQGVSAFPQAVTAEMIKNFARGGAAINVLARQHNACLNVINLGTAFPTGDIDNVIERIIAEGSADFSQTAAMTNEQCQQALSVGAEMAEAAAADNAQLFIAGEMGIANTSAATAIACVLLQRKAEEIAGPGTGLDQPGVKNKAQIIQQAIEKHDLNNNDALTVLQTVGGFEIAAMTGAYIRCAQLGIPVLIDGFISTSAALVASKMKDGVSDWMLFAHASAEPGHQLLMQAFDQKPLIDLGMRLGEGSGAAVAVSILKSACALHNEMATFAEAGVSEKSE